MFACVFFLMSGVGLPISKRLGPGQILLASQFHGDEMNESDRVDYLLPTILNLCILMTEDSFKDPIVNNHLADLIASLLQIKHCARLCLQKKTAEADNPEAKAHFDAYDKKILSTLTRIPDQSMKLSDCIDFCDKEINNILKTVSTVKVLQVLLMLSGNEKVIQSL